MTFAQFQRSLTGRKPPADASPALAALWWAAKDKWDAAHRLVMDEGGTDCARVHAYLHRVEADLENARTGTGGPKFHPRPVRLRPNGLRLPGNSSPATPIVNH